MASRSPNYPSVPLSKALEAIRELWATEKRSPFPPLHVAKAAGYSSLSGTSRSFLAGVRKFGLLEDAGGKEFLRLSPLAINILAHPEGSPERQSSLKEAALTPKLFRELFETFLESSDGSIKAFLITKMRFSDDSAKTAIKSFRDAVRVAGLEQTDLNPTENDDNLNDVEDIDDSDDGSEDQTDSGTKIRKAMTLPKGIMFKASVEMNESGHLNVVFAGEASRQTMALLNEIYQLCDKYDPQPTNPAKSQVGTASMLDNVLLIDEVNK